MAVYRLGDARMPPARRSIGLCSRDSGSVSNVLISEPRGFLSEEFVLIVRDVAIGWAWCFHVVGVVIFCAVVVL